MVSESLIIEQFHLSFQEVGTKKTIFLPASIDVPFPCHSIPTPENYRRTQSVSVVDVDGLKKIIFNDKGMTNDWNTGEPSERARNFSQRLFMSFSSAKKFSKLPRPERLPEKSFNSFMTWSRNFEKSPSTDPEEVEADWIPALNRYFDALEGPELDTLRESEELVLPDDKQWPFLLRFPISTFGMCLGVGSQAMLWKTLATSSSMRFMNVSSSINLYLWCIAVALFSLVSFIYGLKIIFYFEAVRREYYHPVRINFFFAPWIACLFLAIGLPQHVAKTIHVVLWYALMAPIFVLELKIYGQWMSGGERRLSKVANPCNHLAVVGNFVGALLGALMGLKEGPIFFFAVGVAHYTVLFVTLYQRLPTNETLSNELHPVFFLFIAAPSVACTALAAITGEFGVSARIPYFIAMFLYASLAVRANFFRGFRFSLTWWAYTFPMAGSAIATIRYATEVNNVHTKTLALSLAIISTFTVLVLLINTIIHGFVFCNLFPNDIAIAISHKKSKSKKKGPPLILPDIEASECSIK